MCEEGGVSCEQSWALPSIFIHSSTLITRRSRSKVAVRLTTIMRGVISLLMLTNILCAGFCLATGELNDCLRTLEVQCEDMVTSKGFTYRVPHDMTVYLRDRHCEHGWSHMNGTFIADSTISGKKLGPFVDVTPENLTLCTCANIQWQIICDNIQFRCTINYVGLTDTSDFIKNIFICVPKMSEGLTGVERHEVKLRATHDSLPGNYTFSEDKEANSSTWLIPVIVASVIMCVTILSFTIYFFWKKCLRKPLYTPPGEGGSETGL